jgi:nicotinamidase-related amidase
VNPHSQSTAKTDSALLLIDFQRDFLDPDGRLPVAAHHVEPMIRAARQAIADRTPGQIIVKVANQFPAKARIANATRRNAAIAGTPGAAWDPRLDIADACYLPKWKSDAFCNPQLDRLLKEHGIAEVTVAGLYARACVTATVKSALRRGLAVNVLTDGVACRSDATRRRALARLHANGARLI